MGVTLEQGEKVTLTSVRMAGYSPMAFSIREFLECRSGNCWCNAVAVERTRRSLAMTRASS